MKKSFVLIFCLFLLHTSGFAQNDLFEKEKEKSRSGFIINVNGAVDFPAADMAKRFGTDYRVGAALLYKTKSNWIFGPKFDFLFGGKIKEDSLMINIMDVEGTLLDQNGQHKSISISERGYLFGVQGGKVFNISKVNANNGILVSTAAGFMQHRIHIFDKEQTVSQLMGDYKKGYDRLANGLFLEQYVGYSHFSNNGIVNFHIGLDFTAGFTQGRRDYLYDVMRTDDKSRMDILFGIRGGWYIPIFKKKSEEIFFE
jgi:hypothetical protein